MASRQGRADELEMQARRQIVPALVSTLQPIVQRISDLTIQIRHALDARPDGKRFAWREEVKALYSWVLQSAGRAVTVGIGRR